MDQSSLDDDHAYDKHQESMPHEDSLDEHDCNHLHAQQQQQQHGITLVKGRYLRRRVSNSSTLPIDDN